MKLDSHTEVVELDVEQLEAKLGQIEQTLGKETARPFRMLLSWYLSLLRLIQKKNTSIARLRRLLFGARTERTRDVVKREPNSDSANDPSDDGSGDMGNAKDGGADEESGEARPAAAGRRCRPGGGHGRIPARAYTGCTQVVVSHDTLHAGDLCPDCGDGILYQQADWGQVVRLKGQPPVGGDRYELERLRCGLCGKVVTADLPEEAGATKYDPSVASVIATLRYGEGMPWTRIARIQQSAGIPLPSSVQWELVREAAKRGPRAVFRQLLWMAAQGDLMHSDDTRMQIVELTTKRKNGEPLHEDPKRRGVFTSGILSISEERPTIALFFTGAFHAGENLRDVLSQRMTDLPPPLQMCDALSRNMPDDLRTIVSNCLSHGRRKFCDVVGAFPSEVEYVLECLKKVYKIDGEARTACLSSEDRLRLHQRESGPVMDQLHQWLECQFQERHVEPNSSLGEAITYMLNHWEKLTLFLRKPGAPLDNNICERAMKMSIRHRKNSLFYKTRRGAEVGDLYMSLIHTCYFANVDPCRYLTTLQENHERVIANPADWLPWNYQQQLVPETSSTGK